MHRAGSSLLGQADRLVDHLGQIRRPCHPHRPFGQRLCQRDLIHLLKRALTVFANRAVTTQQQHRRVRRPRRQQRPQRVAQACPGSHQSNSQPARELRKTFSHIDRRSLMPRVKKANARIQARVEKRHDLVAREREDVFDSMRRKGLHHHICATRHIEASATCTRTR